MERSRTGIGTHVDVSLFDVQISMLTYLASWQRNRDADVRAHRELRAPDAGAGAELPHRRRPSRAVRRQRRHVATVRRRGRRPGVGVGARFATREGRLEHRDEVIARVQRVLLTASSREWEARLGEVGVACGTVNDVAGALVEPQTARPWARRAERAPCVRALRARSRTAADPGHRRHSVPAPLLGEHTTDVLESLGYSPAPGPRAARRRHPRLRRSTARRANRVSDL